jgi:hypothetical protein
MRILYTSVIELHAGWGAEWSLNKGFQVLGHTTYCIDYRKYRNQLYHRYIAAPECDAFFLQRGDGFPLPIIKSFQVPRLFYTSELVSRCRDHDRLLKSNLFDHVFLRTPSCIDAVVKNGWLRYEQCSVLLSSFDENIHRLLPHVVKDIDVLHIGSVTARRHDFLNKLSGVCRLEVTSAFGEEMVNLMNRAKIVLNIHAEEFLDTETRVFEALGCGAFLLTERLSSESPFSDRDLVQFDSIDDLMDKIRYYLTHDEEREMIAEHGHKSALDGHTYTHRAQEIVEVMTACSGIKSERRSKSLKRNWQLDVYGMSEPFRRLMEVISRKARYYLQKVKQAAQNYKRMWKER